VPGPDGQHVVVVRLVVGDPDQHSLLHGASTWASAGAMVAPVPTGGSAKQSSTTSHSHRSRPRGGDHRGCPVGRSARSEHRRHAAVDEQNLSVDEVGRW
jgi:hypothetical protein